MGLRFDAQTYISGGLFLDTQDAVKSAPPTHSITGSISHSMVPAATMDYTGNPQIVGDVSHSMNVAATMLHHHNYSIDMNITLFNYITGSVLDYTAHPFIVGAVPHSMSVNGLMVYTGATDFAILGNVQHSMSVGAVLDYQQHLSIQGGVTFNHYPDALMVYRSPTDHSIVGDITHIMIPAATLMLYDSTHFEYIQGNIQFTMLINGIMSYFNPLEIGLWTKDSHRSGNAWTKASKRSGSWTKETSVDIGSIE